MFYRNGTWTWLLTDAHFTHFYPVYEKMLRATIDEKCAEQYIDWQYHNATCKPNMENLVWSTTSSACAGYFLVDCILDNIPELAKANMASAGVVLGLMPVILTYLGSTTVEVGMLALRRPFLALLVAVGSPSVNPLRSADYRNPLELLNPAVKPFQPAGIFTRFPMMQSLVQYLAGFAAITNLVLVARDLTRLTIIGNDVNRDYQIVVWACWAVGVHLFGTIAVWLRVEIGDKRRRDRNITVVSRIRHAFDPVTLRIRNLIELTTQPDRFSRLQDMFAPSNMLPPTTIRLKRQTWLFTILAWLVTIGTVGHLMYGTLVLSSVLFVSGGEAVGIVARCMASVALCRMVLMYELSGMGKTTVVETKDPEDIMLTGLNNNGSIPFDNRKVPHVGTSYTGLSIP